MAVDLRGRMLGSAIGAVGGLVFVLVNAGGLAGATALRVAAAALFVATVVAVVRRPVASPEPEPRALRVYLVCVAAMVVAIPVGAAVLNALDRPELTLCWVVLVVGLHFLPFASAFRAPVFLPLGALLAAVGLAGGAAALADVDDAAPVTGVVAGFVLLAFALYGVLAAQSGD